MHAGSRSSQPDRVMYRRNVRRRILSAEVPIASDATEPNSDAIVYPAMVVGHCGQILFPVGAEVTCDNP